MVRAKPASVSQWLRTCMRAPARDAAASTIALIRARTPHARESLLGMPRAELTSVLQRRRLWIATHAEDRAALAAFRDALALHPREFVGLVMHAEAAAAS